jgi:hypothetical protein
MPRVARNTPRAFSPHDDAALLRLITEAGTDDWTYISCGMNGAFTPRQCRMRFQNYLDPKLAHIEWSKEEDRRLTEDYDRLGPRWIAIAKRFGDRSANAVRNRMTVLIRQREREEKADRHDRDPTDPSPSARPDQYEPPPTFLAAGQEAQIAESDGEYAFRMLFSHQ